MQIQRIAAFTRDGRGGNPAGVVLLDTMPPREVMQRVAAEVGYSETVFAAPKGESWDVRYFSPETEVPFCGHATIALGAALARARGAGRFQLTLVAGPIALEAEMRDGVAHARLWSPPTRNRPVPRPLLTEALALFGYAEADLDPALAPKLAHAGADHLIMPLRSRELLAAMTYDLEAGRRLLQRHGLVTVALVWRAEERVFHARNAFASGGVIEDPATGAAAAALAGLLRDTGALGAGTMTVLQGDDMGVPSTIETSFTAVAGSPVEVAGATAIIAPGLDAAPRALADARPLAKEQR